MLCDVVKQEQRDRRRILFREEGVLAFPLEVIAHPPHLLGPARAIGIFINPVLPEWAAERLRAVLGLSEA